ncbi:MAG: Trk system potassium transporter TrkA [Thalassobaculales bacterium]
MRVVICGAGQVGTSIARYLAGEGNDVTVIDKEPALIQRINEQLDVRAIVGFASHPAVLEQAGTRDADMIIAVTYADEVNMVACEVAHALFKVPTKVARIRHQGYLDRAWSDLFSRENLPIDVIISPEIEVAAAVFRRLQVPGAFDLHSLADDLVKVVGVRCGPECPLLNTPLRQLTSLFPDLSLVVVGIVRNDKAIVPTAEDQMLEGDEVYFVCDSRHLQRAMAAFGHEESEARRLVIAGGGNIGLGLAQRLEQAGGGFNVKIIEYNRERAEALAAQLPGTMVLHGDALDPEILDEANVRQAETFVAVTNEDEVNIMASLVAKRYGCQRAVTLVNNVGFGPMVATLGIDTVVNPKAITVSTILQHVRRGRIRAVHSLRDGLGEVIEGEAMETSPLVGVPLREAKLPAGIIVGAVVRQGMVLMPRADTVVEAKDRVVLFAASAVVKKVDKLFSVRLEFF